MTKRLWSKPIIWYRWLAYKNGVLYRIVYTFSECAFMWHIIVIRRNTISSTQLGLDIPKVQTCRFFSAQNKKEFQKYLSSVLVRDTIWCAEFETITLHCSAWCRGNKQDPNIDKCFTISIHCKHCACTKITYKSKKPVGHWSLW